MIGRGVPGKASTQPQASVQGLVFAALWVVALAELSRQLAFSDQSLSLVWPISGFGLAMLYRWQWRGLLALLAGLVAWSGWHYGANPLAVPAVALAGSIGPAAVWAATRRTMSEEPRPFERIASVTRWLKAELLVGAPLAATCGVAVLGLVEPPASDRSAALLVLEWAGYWIIESCGALLVAPVAWHLMIGQPGSRFRQRVRELLADLTAHRGLLWLSPLMASLLAATFALGDTSNAQAFSYFLLPVLLVVANQCRPAAVHAHVMFAALLVTAASAFSMRHLHPNAGADMLVQLVLLVLFLLVSAGVLLVLVAVYAERHEALERLQSLAFIDPLTELLTDAGLARAYEQRDPAAVPALVLVRLANWRAIEYLDGPAALGALETAAARRLRAVAPTVVWARSTPGRYVGLLTETALRSGDLAQWQASVAAATARDAGQATEQQVRPLWRSCAVIAPAGAEPSPGLQTLLLRLREIDLAQADDADPVLVRMHPEDGERLRAMTTGVERVRRAITERRLHLVAQPIVSLREGQARVAAEVLVRLRDEDGHDVPPAQFMAAAVQGELMPLLDRAVVEEAAAMFARHPAALARIDYCSINLSGPTLARADLGEWLAGLFGRYAVPAQRVVFEITESQAIAQPRDAAQSLARLREEGFRVAIDDFGTGHATFDYLKRFPVDIIKIDGAFVRELQHQPVDRVIVRAMVEVARVLQVKTVAEFVESAELLERVRELGIDAAQGYHLGRPRPLDDWLAEVSSSESTGGSPFTTDMAHRQPPWNPSKPQAV
nr:EAL domain-containing protein [Tepidicella baoligensis]